MNMIIALVLGTIIGAVLVARQAFRSRQRQEGRIRNLSVYLERAVAGQAPILETSGEDEISQLQDEIVKTVTALEYARRRATEDKEAFAENLANIAHQIKTPLVTMSLAANELPDDEQADVIRRQLKRLMQLQEDLLMMARIDSGALAFDVDDCDAYTLLETACDSIGDLAAVGHVILNVEEHGAVTLRADQHWMCEALSNILKNCVEHAPAHSVVHASYADNPLYTEFRISDDGPGFSTDDLAHLFERFYQGRGSVTGATGLGLSFARQLIEAQTGTITAENPPPPMAEPCSKSESTVTPLSLCIRKLAPRHSSITNREVATCQLSSALTSRRHTGKARTPSMPYAV